MSLWAASNVESLGCPDIHTSGRSGCVAASCAASSFPHDRHDDVRQHQRHSISVLLEQRQRLLAVPRLERLVSLVDQDAGQKLTHGVFVLHDQHRR